MYGCIEDVGHCILLTQDETQCSRNETLTVLRTVLEFNRGARVNIALREGYPAAVRERNILLSLDYTP